MFANEKGLAVELEPSVEAFIPATDLPEEYQAILAKKFPAGCEVQLVIHSIDEKERRIQAGLVLEDEGKDSKPS